VKGPLLKKIEMKSNTDLLIAAIISGVLFFGLGFFFGQNSNQKQIENSFNEELENEEWKEFDQSLSQKSKVCNEDTALENFRYWMDFNYPDWKIFGEVSIVSAGDCAYNLRFTTINPNLIGYGGDKEVIVVQLNYVNDYQQFNVKFLRGILY
jgi:hypothetical protein